MADASPRLGDAPTWLGDAPTWLDDASTRLDGASTRLDDASARLGDASIPDILTRPAPELSDAEREEVKKVARQLLQKVRELLGTMWRGTQQGRSRMHDVIKDTLDGGLPRAYDKPLYEAKAEAVFEHIYECSATDA